ncbi:MAG: hypothetical protein Q8P41_12945 [Pseudomonadota bacterium]|nr:hypothetical protein [Pseudomonadota bacterium]
MLEALPVDPASTDAEWLAAFEHRAEALGWSPSTRSHYRRHLGMYLRWRANPVAVRPLHGHEPPVDLAGSLAAVVTPDERVYLLLLERGLTPAEAEALPWRAVSERLLTVRNVAGRFRYLPMNAALWGALTGLDSERVADGFLLAPSKIG